MYARAGRSFLGNFPLFALFAAILAAADVIFEQLEMSNNGAIGASLVLYAMATLYSHRLLLSGEKIPMGALFRKSKNGPLAGPQGPFMLKLIVFWLLAAVAWALCSWGIYNTLEAPDRGKIFGVVILGILPAALLVYVVLALLGTVLPAAAALQDSGFSNALARGQRTFWVTLFRLLSGNGLFSLAGFAGMMLLILSMGNSSMIVVEAGLGFLGELVGFFGIHLTAAALCMAYEDSLQTSGERVPG
ncbi:hypothetical protein ACOHWE_08805 [Cribrihabitans neustonicus]